MLTLFLLTCAEPTGLAALRACEDLACQEAALPGALAADPAGTLDWVAALSDPLVQVAMVTAVGAHDPALLDGRCQRLRPEAAQRCDRFVERPHLGQAPTPAASRTGRPAPGPASSTPRLPERPAVLPSPDDQVAVARACGGDHACLRQAARDAGAALAPARAEAACQGLPPGDHSRDECRFRAAESAVATAGLDGLSPALDLCAASAYAGDCLSHCLALALPPASPADAVDPAAVAAMAEAATRIQGEVGGEAGAEAADLAWNLWVNAAYGVGGPGLGPQARGDLLDHVPAAAAPHVRFAVASQVAMARPEDTVVALVIATRQALGQRGDPVPGAPLRPVVVPRIGGHLWEADLPGEEQVPATWARGPTRRPTSADPEVDLQLAVIAALAMNPGRPPGAPLLAVLGDASADPQVQWAAALVLSQRTPRLLVDWAARHPDLPPLAAGRVARVSPAPQPPP